MEKDVPTSETRHPSRDALTARLLCMKDASATTQERHSRDVITAEGGGGNEYAADAAYSRLADVYAEAAMPIIATVMMDQEAA